MKESIRLQVWSILEKAFSEIHQSLLRALPGTLLRLGHYENEAFPFRAYAELVVSDRTVVISFNIQASANRLNVTGDIAKESGFVLKDLMNVALDATTIDNKHLMDLATEFAEQSKEETELIRKELT